MTESNQRIDTGAAEAAGVGRRIQEDEGTAGAASGIADEPTHAEQFTPGGPKEGADYGSPGGIGDADEELAGSGES